MKRAAIILILIIAATAALAFTTTDAGEIVKRDLVSWPGLAEAKRLNPETVAAQVDAWIAIASTIAAAIIPVILLGLKIYRLVRQAQAADEIIDGITTEIEAVSQGPLTIYRAGAKRIKQGVANAEVNFSRKARDRLAKSISRFQHSGD